MRLIYFFIILAALLAALSWCLWADCKKATIPGKEWDEFRGKLVLYSMLSGIGSMWLIGFVLLQLSFNNWRFL